MQKFKKKNPMWSKHLIITLIMSFLLSMSMNMETAILPVFAQSVGGNNSVGGMIMGIMSLSVLLFRSTFGNLLDTKGRKIVVIIGLLIFAFGSLVYSLVYSLGMVLLARFLQGVGFSAQNTGTGTIVSDIVPSNRLGEGLGYVGISNTLATAIGPSLALYIVSKYSYSSFFTFSAAFGVIAVFVLSFLNYEKFNFKNKINDKESKNVSIKKAESKKVTIEKTALPAAFVITFLMPSLSGIFALLTSYAAYRGIKNIGLFFTFYAIGFFITRFFTNKLDERFGNTKVIVTSFVIMMISILILATANSLSLFLVAAILYGLGFGSSQPILNALAIIKSPSDRKGAANATFLSGMDVGSCIGSFGLGIIAQLFGFQWAYYIGAASIVLGLLIYLFTMRDCNEELSSNETIETC